MRSIRSLLQARRARSGRWRRVPGPRQFRTAWGNLRRALPDLELVRPAPLQPPFFTTLHTLLDRHPVITLDRLLEEAGDQSWGLTLMVLAMFTFIPALANIVSLATILVGVGMMRRSPHPWLPASLRRLEIHRGRVKKLLAEVESRIAWLAARRGPRQVPSHQAMGILVAWTGFLAVLPIPLPFANVLPATALVLFGVALVEEWPLMAWYGALVSVGSTIYFAFSIQQILLVFQGLWRWGARLFTGARS